MQRVSLTLLSILAIGVGWLGFSVFRSFDNWPWTIVRTYDSGTLNGIGVGSTKSEVIDQIVLRQQQGGFFKLTLVDGTDLIVAQEREGGPLTPIGRQSSERADHWIINPRRCGDHFIKPVCTMKLQFSSGKLQSIAYETYFGPTDF